MAVSRIDILNREFTRSLRGYNPEEVDNFLHDVADTLGRLGDEKVVLSSRVVQLESRLAEFEEQEAALRNTLLATQRMTEDLKSGAQREAQLIIDAARSRADNLLQQANQRLTRIFDEIAEAKKLKTQFEISVRSVVESHLKLLDMQRENEARLDAGVARLGFNGNYNPQYQPGSRQDYYSPNEHTIHGQAQPHQPAQAQGSVAAEQRTQPQGNTAQNSQGGSQGTSQNIGSNTGQNTGPNTGMPNGQIGGQINGQAKPVNGNGQAGAQPQASANAPGANQNGNQGSSPEQNPGAAQGQLGAPSEGRPQEQQEQEILLLQKVEDPLELGVPGKGERYRG